MSSAASPIEHLPVTGLVAFTQTALGFGMGLLVAGTMKKSVQRNAALAVLGVGTLATVPLIVDLVARLIRGPESELGMRRRLESIRRDPGFDASDEIL